MTSAADDLEPLLDKFATPRQLEILNAVREHRSINKAASHLGCHPKTVWQALKAVKTRARRRGYDPEFDMNHPAPEGFRLKGASTLYGPDGEQKQQWVKTEADKDRQHEMMLQVVKELTEGIKPQAPKKSTVKHANEHLMACYPIGDHHLGMLSWDEETGANYDIAIGENLLVGALDHLIGVAPPCERAMIVFLGDFMHYDGLVAETPTGRNSLDSDTRYPKVVAVAIRMVRYAIERALKRHNQVHVVIEIGNHDLSSMIFLMQCISSLYENEPRVTVDTSPAHYHYYRFGQNLIGIHHGHGSKMADLPLIMATDRSDDWGATKFRYWWTGHIHKRKRGLVESADDYPGCEVESFRILAPADAWASQKGYRSHRDMKMILLHSEYGEVSRSTVNPLMLEATP